MNSETILTSRAEREDANIQEKWKNRDEKASTVQNVASCKTHIYANVHSVTL